MTCGKCIFCEGILGETGYPQIDHYMPKAHFPDLAFEWSNLLPVCQICNREKGDSNHKRELLKPNEEDPEPLLYLNAEGFLEPLDASASERVALTIKLCGLNRGGLVSSRRRLWQDLTGLLSGDPVSWALGHLGEPARPFKFVLRSYLERADRCDLADQDRDLFAR